MNVIPASHGRRIEDVTVDRDRFAPRVRPVEVLRIDWDLLAMSFRAVPLVPREDAITTPPDVDRPDG